MRSEALEPRRLFAGATDPFEIDAPPSQAADESTAQAVQFGLVNGARVKSARATGGDGTPFVFSLSGPGTATAFPEEDGFRLVLDGTTAASSLNVVATPFGQLTGITVNGSLKKLSGRRCSVNGNILVTGTLASATLFALGTVDEQTVHFDINGSGVPSNLTIALVADTLLTSASPIKSLKVGVWAEFNAERDSITAPTIGKLQATGGQGVTGGFAADVNVTEPVEISLGGIKVVGPLEDSVIRSAGAIGTTMLGAMRNSTLFAGVDPAITGLPTKASDFVITTAIRSVTVTGTSDGESPFADSMIAASVIGRVRLGVVDAASGTAPFGVATTFIVSYSRSTAGAFLNRRNLVIPGEYDHEGNFFVRILG
jgi:hypothetical protein